MEPLDIQFFSMFLIFSVSFLTTFVMIPLIIPLLKEKNIVGQDMHKKGKPKIPRMGGIAVFFGILFGLLVAIALYTFTGFQFDMTTLMAGIITLSIIAIIGLLDDILDLPQKVKAILPLFAAIPLMVIRAGTTSMAFPFIGLIDFGIIYTVILLPLGIAVASNLTNMLAGFNGNEAGMGIIMFIVILIVSFYSGNTESFIISLVMLASLTAFIYYNWYPAKIFPDDTATLLIGGALAVCVIIGNMETIGAILVIPHVVDFFIKLPNKFPKTFGVLSKDGKIYAPAGKVKGLGQLIMKLSGGIKETHLTMVLIIIEVFFGIIALVKFFIYNSIV